MQTFILASLICNKHFEIVMHNVLLCSLGALQAGSDKLHSLTPYELPSFCVLIFYVCNTGNTWRLSFFNYILVVIDCCYSCSIIVFLKPLSHEPL